MGNYDDIINLPHHVSKTRHQMSISNRAAQFAPFAALTGHGEAIKETARLTDKRIELTEDTIEILNMKLGIVVEHISEQLEVAITYFQPDKNKDGGKCVTAVGIIKKIDDYEEIIIMVDGTKILITEIIEIESELIKEFL